ncbi:MAG: hypothetical protein QM710_14220 [Flavobacterium sp.]
MFKSSSHLYDLDLFIFLPEIRIHIATGGAKIPQDLLNLTKNNLSIYNHFNQEKYFNTQIEFNPRLEEIVYANEREKNPEFNSDIYLESFSKFARQGFYSFDKTNISNAANKKFHLVSYPANLKDSENEMFRDLSENALVLNNRKALIDSINDVIASKLFNPITLVY